MAFPSPPARRPATASTPSRTSWRCGASSPTAAAGSRCPPRSNAPGRWRARPTARRSSPRWRPAAPRCARRSCTGSTLIALSRAIEEEAMARAAGPIVIGAFQSEAQLPPGRAPLPAPRARRGRRRGVRRLRDAPATDDEDLPAEIPIGSRRRARARVGGGRRRARLRRVPGRVGDAVARTASGSSRPSGRWTRRSCAARRRWARRSRRAARRSGRSACSAMLADRPLAVEVARARG